MEEADTSVLISGGSLHSHFLKTNKIYSTWQQVEQLALAKHVRKAASGKYKEHLVQPLQLQREIVCPHMMVGPSLGC